MNRDPHEDLMEALQELEATPQDRAAWVSIVQWLSAWPEQRITQASQERLLAVLGETLPQRSPVRQAIRTRLERRGRLVSLLATVHSQVHVLRLSFWVLSLLLALLGVVMEVLSSQHVVSLAWLRALAPLLASFSVASVFRSTGLQTLEWELACPPSALELIIARLVIVLGYDIALGLLLSLVGWTEGGESFLVVTLHWLVPLLLIAGLALVLSLRFPVPFSAGLAYSGWLILLVLGTSFLERLFSFQNELLLGLVGVGMLIFALWRVKRQIPHHFLATL